MNVNYYFLILLCGLVTWLPRILPFIFSSKIQFPKKVEVFMSYLPLCILAALFFQSLFDFHENSWPQLKIPELIACIPTLFVGYYSKDLMKIVVTGIISIALIRLFL